MDSEQNKEMILREYQLFQAGDIEGLLQFFADDVEWVGAPTEFVTFSVDYHGKQEVRQFFAEMGKAQEAEQFEPQEVIAEGDKVVVTGQSRWTVKATGQSYDNPWVHIFTIRDGKIVRFQQFNDTAASRAAFMPTDTASRGTDTKATLRH